MKNKEKYKDVIQYVEARLALTSALESAKEIKDHYKKQLYLHIVEQRQNEIDAWLNAESE